MNSSTELGNIITLQRGYDLPNRDRISGPYPIISSSGISGTHNEYKVSGENVITGRYGTIGEVYYYSGKCWPLNTSLFVKDFHGNNTRYSYYLLKHALKMLKIDGKDKSTVPGVDRNVLHQLKVPFIPSVSCQKEIVHILELLDKKIENNMQINDNLAKQLNVLYQYWFMQFQFPDKDGKPYLSNQGEMQYNSRLKKNIPIRWKVQSIAKNDLSSIIKPGVEHFTSKTYYPTSEVNGTTIGNGAMIDFETRESRANMQPTEYSVWFAKMKNSVKHLFLNPELKPIIDSSILSTGFSGLQCDEKSFEYISSVISSEYFETNKDTLAHGATQEAVNNDDLANIFFVIPDNTTLEKYHVVAEKLFSQISNNIIESKELTNLRDWLLPMLMNGQVSVNS